MAKKKKPAKRTLRTGLEAKKKRSRRSVPRVEDLKVLLRPLGDRVLVIPDVADGTSPGGIVLPNSAKEVPQAGTVVRVGPGRRIEGVPTTPRVLTDPLRNSHESQRHDMDVKEGDRVYFNKFAGVDVKLSENAKPLKLLREDDVLAVLGE